MPEIYVPELGESVTEATVGKWLKSEGEEVTAGEPVVELETDKINFEVEAEQDGVLESIAKGEGETVNVGEVIGTIGEGDGRPAEQPEEEEAPEGVAEAAEEEQPEAEATDEEAVEEDGHREMEDGVRASPSVRRLAREYDIDLAEVSGSGSGGRVTREDVERLIRDRTAEKTEEPPAAPEEDGRREERPAAEDGRGALEERVRMSRRRQTIARRLVEAQQTAAMLTTFNEADMTAVMDLRNQRKEEFQERHGVKLGFMSFFVKASIGALKAFPKINAELQGDELILKHYYDIGVAVNTEEGLVVPVVRDADKKSFADIEQAIGDLAVKAANGSWPLRICRAGRSPSPTAASSARWSRPRSSTRHRWRSWGCTRSRSAPSSWTVRSRSAP